jgi:hypothetical protein
MLPEMMRQTAEHFSLAFWSLASISSRAASSSLARLGFLQVKRGNEARIGEGYHS